MLVTRCHFVANDVCRRFDRCLKWSFRGARTAKNKPSPRRFPRNTCNEKVIAVAGLRSSFQFTTMVKDNIIAFYRQRLSTVRMTHIVLKRLSDRENVVQESIFTRHSIISDTYFRFFFNSGVSRPTLSLEKHVFKITLPFIRS